MRVEEIGIKISKLSSWLLSLRGLVSRLSPKERRDFLNTIEHVQRALEELQAIDEELRDQNEALAAAQLQLHQERERYRDLFNAAPDGYVITDTQGVIIEANHAFYRLVQVPEPCLRDKRLIYFLSHDAHRKLFVYLGQFCDAAATSPMPDFGAHLLQGDGRRLPILISGGAMNNSAGCERTMIRWVVREQSGQARMAVPQQSDGARRVLLVESDAQRAGRLQGMLQGLGLDADVASSAEEAARKSSGQAFDVVIRDLPSQGDAQEGMRS